jgi:MOSC domain-containing protein YiiM
MTTVQRFIGGLTRLDDEGQSTGIYKQRVEGSIQLGNEGFFGDMQADRRVHGGPEKAVHHYPAESYRTLADRFPAAADQLTPGSIGENLSTFGWDESSVCIGDIFRLGETMLQVSQPRSPCWKIDHRYGLEGMARFIGESGLTGWYYRVLETGEVASGAHFELTERLPGAVSLTELWQHWREHRPDPDALARLVEAPGLTPGWQKKLLDRLNWLRANAGSQETPPPAFHVKPIRS